MTSLQSLHTNIEQPKPSRAEILDRVQFLLNNRKLFSQEEYIKEARKLITEGEKYGIDSELRILLDPRLDRSADTGLLKISTGKNHFAYLSLKTEKELKDACTFIQNYRTQFPYKLLKKLALRVLSLSSRKGNVLSDDERSFLERFAGLGIATKEEVLDGIKKRAACLEKRGYYVLSKKVNKLAEEVQNTDLDTFYSSGLADKIMETFTTIDAKTKLARYYGRGITPPEDFLFSFTKKDYEEFDQRLIKNVKTGKAYDIATLNRLDLKLIQMVLGDQSWVQFGCEVDVDGLKNWLKQASYKEAERFDEIMEFSGIEPVIERN